ncbi:MAG: kynureninase [Acidimicrobiia bacterium]
MPMFLGPFSDGAGYDRALDLDENDPLADFRRRYVVGDPDLIYLDGNSLGRLPRETPALVDEVVRRGWGDRLIRSWNEGWWDLQLELGDRLSPLIGASPGEVIISDSTSVNLYKLAMAAMHARPARNRIVTDDMNFPTDVYVLQGVADAHDASLEIVPTAGADSPAAAVEAALDQSTAIVSLSHTAFKSGYTYDLASMTGAAHRAGALVLWDLSHSVGAMPIELNRSGADLAVGCTYKYLNGGPGSPAFLFVRADLQSELANPITAWWGHAEPFAFDLGFRPVEGIRKFHTGTMPILSLAPVAAGISDVIEAGVPRIRAKSVSLSEYLIEQWEEHLAPLGLGLASPRDPNRRGSHVSLSHDEAWPVARALIEIGQVIPDFRAPDNLRLGLSPLYTTHIEIHTALQRLRFIVESGAHTAFAGETTIVT